MITDTPKEIILDRIKEHKTFFATHATKSVQFRIEQLKKLKKTILNHHTKIQNALWEDLHKSPEEAYLTEISIVLGEIDNHLRHLKGWAAPRRVPTPIHLLPSRSKIIYEPLGVALIIAPWNYPFQLLMNPLVGAISAGCCTMLKPSPDAPSIAMVMQDIIEEAFDANYISMVHGGKETNTIVFHEPFDLIFFTGSSYLGRIVMKAAADNLTPVILELGGKSPCIVDKDANIDIAARRVAWGKLMNAGQTCIAPDYLFAHKAIHDQLLDKIAKNIREMYGDNINESRYYPRIISSRALDRLEKLMQQGDIHTGGNIDKEQKFIEPTIITNVKPEFAIMQEEIFGPILPVLTYDHIDEALGYINKQAKPLALYYFGKNAKAKEVLTKTTSGGACINDTLMHITNHHLPFGGVGNSGIGQYHGKESFEAFSNKRAVVSTPTWIDLPFKYAPFKYFKWVKKIL